MITYAANFGKMRGFLLVTVSLFIFQSVLGQLSVAPSNNGQKNTYLYINDDLLFVQNDLRLRKNPAQGKESSIYLRSGAQLIQGEGQNISNSGDGSISVFSEGSTNAYDYNYWSSPVIDPGNGLFGISLLHSPVSEINSRPAHLTNALNGSANPLTISTSWIYTFNGNSYSQWNFVGGNTIIPPGYGFTMKGTEGNDPTSINGRENNPGNAQRYDFRGRPVSGRIEIPTVRDVYILVGNPYPSTFDLSLFLLENSGSGTLNTTCYENLSRRNVTTGIAYFWDSKENGDSHYLQDYVGGYGAFSPVDPCTDGIYEPPVLKKINGTEEGKGKDFDRRLLPIAQGFMVQGAETGNIIFRNSHRKARSEKPEPGTGIASITEKKHTHLENSTVLPRIQLKVSVNDQYERKLSVAFWNEATKEIDAGMDAEAFQLAPTDAGWLHGENSFVIDVRPFDITEEIPLFLQVNAQLSKVTFSLEKFENTSVNELFIVDTQTNDYFSIKKETLTLELQPGTYHGRFKIAFAEKIPQEELPTIFFEDEAVPEKFSVVQNNHLGELQIISNDQFPVKAIGIFDLQGKRLLYRTSFDNKRSVEISTRLWSNGVYLVKVMSMDNKRVIKKISVYNNNF